MICLLVLAKLQEGFRISSDSAGNKYLSRSWMILMARIESVQHSVFSNLHTYGRRQPLTISLTLATKRTTCGTQKCMKNRVHRRCFNSWPINKVTNEVSEQCCLPLSKVWHYLQVVAFSAAALCPCISSRQILHAHNQYILATIHSELSISTLTMTQSLHTCLDGACQAIWPL